MIEFLHRPTEELFTKDELLIRKFVARGLIKRACGQLLFAGFDARFASDDIYMPPKNSTYGVTTEEWQEAIKYGGDLDSPLFYAWGAVEDGNTGNPAIGVYDAGLLLPDGQVAGVSRPVQDASLADTCLRIVVWDL